MVGILWCFKSLEQAPNWAFFRPLEEFWKLNIESKVISHIWRFETQVMAKRMVNNQIGKKIPHH
jgi:hypothetical protein